MPVKYLIDENLRGRLWQMIQRHNALGINLLEAVRVGDIPELPLRSPDPDILEWSDRNDHILVTFDKTTMPQFFQQRIAAGQHHPGMFLLKQESMLPAVMRFLELAAYASDPSEWRDCFFFIP